MSKEVEELSGYILGERSFVEGVNFTRNLKVYRDNYFYSLLGQLSKVYFITKKILGDDNFNYFSKKYIEKTPSLSSNLDCYGDQFGVFLSKQSEIEDLFYIGQIAKIDRFWYTQEIGNKLEVWSGSFELWSSMYNELAIGRITIDCHLTEVLKVRFDQSGDYILEKLNV